MKAIQYKYKPNAQNYLIREKPDTLLPLKRLHTEGADVLQVRDLLRIAMGRVNGLEDWIQEYGLYSLTHIHSVADIKEMLKLDDVQATQLMAILGLGKRLYGQSQDPLTVIRNIEDVYDNYRSMSSLTKEQLRVLLINSRYQLVYEETVAIGGSEWLQTSPIELLQPAVARHITSIILVNNHPTGDPTPSQADLRFTKHMQKAAAVMGVELIDHVIIGKGGYSSCLPSVKASRKKSSADL